MTFWVSAEVDVIWGPAFVVMGYADYVSRTSGFVPLPPRCASGP